MEENAEQYFLEAPTRLEDGFVCAVQRPSQALHLASYIQAEPPKETRTMMAIKASTFEAASYLIADQDTCTDASLGTTVSYSTYAFTLSAPSEVRVPDIAEITATNDCEDFDNTWPEANTHKTTFTSVVNTAILQAHLVTAYAGTGEASGECDATGMHDDEATGTTLGTILDLPTCGSMKHSFIVSETSGPAGVSAYTISGYNLEYDGYFLTPPEKFCDDGNIVTIRIHGVGELPGL